MNMKSAPSLIHQTCAHCHEGVTQNFAPLFNFNDPKIVGALGSLICDRTKRPLRDEHHMPKFIELEKGQLEMLYNYFKLLNPTFSCNG